MDGNITDWRKFACDRINGFRSGTYDFDGLLMAFTVLAKVYESGQAPQLRPSVWAAVKDFLVVAESFAASASPPPLGAIDGVLEALRIAIGCQIGGPEGPPSATLQN